VPEAEPVFRRKSLETPKPSSAGADFLAAPSRMARVYTGPLFLRSVVMLAADAQFAGRVAAQLAGRDAAQLAGRAEAKLVEIPAAQFDGKDACQLAGS